MNAEIPLAGDNQTTDLTRSIIDRLNLAPYANGQPSISLSELNKNHSKGPKRILGFLNEFRRKLIGYRNVNGVAPNLKTQAALVLHEEYIGDESQLIMDTADPESCIAYGEYLFANGATEIWMGTAHDNDMTDTHGTKKAETPLIKGIKSIDDLKQIINLLWGKVSLDQVSPELMQANLDKKGNQRLEQVDNYMPNYYVEKLSKRYAMAFRGISSDQWDKLKRVDQNMYLDLVHDVALDSISQIMAGNSTWDKLNQVMKNINQPPINPEDHPLHKIFRQDRNEWQIADLMATPTSIILEIPRTKYTHREGDGNGTIKIEFLYEDGKPIVVCDPEDYKYLPYLLNSIKFFDIFENKCLPRLGDSPYYQLEIMLDTNHQKTAFGTDVIAGMPEKNMGSKNIGIKQPISLSKFLPQIDQATFRSIETHTKITEYENALIFLSDLEQGYISKSLSGIIAIVSTIFPSLFSNDKVKNMLQHIPIIETKDDSDGPVQRIHGQIDMDFRPTQKDLALMHSILQNIKQEEISYKQVQQAMNVSSALVAEYDIWSKADTIA